MRVGPSLLAAVFIPVLAACEGGVTWPGPPGTAIEIAGGDDQEALVFTVLSEPLSVRVHQNGAPVAGVAVQWTATAGAVTPTSAVTDANGMAAATWTFGTPPGPFTVGTHQVTATAEDVGSVTFTGHARAGIELRSIAFTPDEVDVTSDGATVSVSVHASTDFQALSDVSVRFTSPSLARSTGFVALTRTSGTDADGVWAGDLTIQENVEPGVWTLSGVRITGPFGALLADESVLQELDLPYQLTVTVTPVGSTDPDELLFVSGRYAPERMLDIFRMRADGSGVVNLTDRPATVYRGMSFSPDGRSFLVNSTREGCYEIWAMNIDGSNARKLTSPEGRHDRCNYFARYSPDGSRIVLTSSRGGSWSTWVMNADGSDPREVAAAMQQASPGSSWSQGWTPDGRVLIYHVPADTGGPFHGTYAVLLDGSDPRRLLSGSRDSEPRWSPNGGMIAFHRLEGIAFENARTTVYVMNADGTGERKLADLPGESAFAGAWVWDNDHDPWSPDGSMLVFRNEQPGAAALYVVNADGTGLRRLTDQALNARFNGWSPDGLRIAFTGTTGGVSDVYVMGIDGTALANLSRGKGSSSAAIWIPR